MDLESFKIYLDQLLDENCSFSGWLQCWNVPNTLENKQTLVRICILNDICCFLKLWQISPSVIRSYFWKIEHFCLHANICSLLMELYDFQHRNQPGNEQFSSSSWSTYILKLSRFNSKENYGLLHLNVIPTFKCKIQHLNATAPH